MKCLNPKNIILFCTLNFLIVLNSYSQDEYSNWVFGAGVNAVDYYPTDTPPPIGGGWFSQITNANDHWNVPGLKLNATKYIVDKITFDLSFSFINITKLGETQGDFGNYYAFDGNVHYNFIGTDKTFVPYVLIGGGYATGDELRGGGTFNSGIGGNLWLSRTIGINAEGILKYNSPDFSLLPHFYYSFSVLFRVGNSSPAVGRYRRYRWRSRM